MVKSVVEFVNVAKVVPASFRITSAPSASKTISVVESSVRSPVEFRFKVPWGVIVRFDPSVVERVKFVASDWNLK